MVRSWDDMFSYTRLDLEFQAVRSRFAGGSELGGQFPYLSIAVEGRSLDIYYPLTSPHSPQSTLLRPLGGDYGSAHRLGMLAHSSTNLFLLMLKRFTIEGDAYRDQLLRLIDDPSYQLPDALVSESTQSRRIEQWANTHLPTLWSKTGKIKRYFDRELEHACRLFGIPESRVRALSDANIHVLIVHDDAATAFDAAFRGKARTVFAELQENDWKADVVERVVGSKVNEIFANDNRGLRELFELILEYRIHTVTTRGDLIVPVRLTL